MYDDLLCRRILLYASISGAIGIAMGAFGAHYLPVYLDHMAPRWDTDAQWMARRMDQFDVGVRYHLIHSVALLALASIERGSVASRRWTARLFLLRIMLFSGSLYVLVLSNVTQLGAVTPIGGMAWIVGWLMLIWVTGGLRRRERRFAQIRGRQP